ncbi:C-C motif chemokine 21-like isoform X1 [Synchiropus splendidus]|uniref:C-C motif chemokine 21-like isoform X1 n=1 Tax=Synchiropus splendidus TaxID=270530 RepID=UPI00237DE27E|nr:C-C motif chemokine 21-like isoform X1 [Synchiropus splendidus]
MAALNASKLFLVCIFIACCSSVWFAEARLSDCCLSVSDKKVDKKWLADYYYQVEGQGCAINAIIFVTRRQKMLCLPVDSPQAGRLIKHVDHLKDVCRENKHQKKRCFGVNQTR